MLLGYGVVSFAVLQVVEPIMHGLGLPDSVLKIVVVLLGLGFPVAVVLAWAFDVNAGAIERTAPALGSALWLRGTRLALVLVGIGLLAAAPGSISYFFVRDHSTPATTPSRNQPTPSTPSIAVLPFADMSPGKDQEYFSDGIAEEILNALTHVEGLRVIGRTSSFSFKGKNTDLRTIGRELSVGTVLEGSVRKAGEKVRITTQLIDATDGAHLWSETYDRNLADVFAVQEEIARAVVAALRVKLIGGQGPSTKDYETQNMEAHNQYLLGRTRYDGSPRGAERAVKAFEKAITLDPGYGPAWAELSRALSNLALLGDPTGEGRDYWKRSLAAADKVVMLAPNFATGYARRAWVRNFAWDWQGARSDLERALAIEPRSIDTRHVYAAWLHLPRGWPGS